MGNGNALNYESLKAALLSERPITPVVQFTAAGDEQEGYFEGRMMARLTRLIRIHEEGSAFEFLELEMNVAEFEAYNDSVEKRSYYDRHDQPVLSSKEAGYYPKGNRATFYVNKADFDETPYFLIVADDDLDVTTPEFRRNLIAHLTPLATAGTQPLPMDALQAWAKGSDEAGLDSAVHAFFKELAIALFMAGDMLSPMALMTRRFLKARVDSRF